jgi:uncharacterized protein YukE
MFNYDQTDVVSIRQVVQTQFTTSQDNTSALQNAVSVVRNGAWTGEGAEAFLADAARLSDETEAMHTTLAAFISQLGQAAGVADETINTLYQLIAGLP